MVLTQSVVLFHFLTNDSRVIRELSHLLVTTVVCATVGKWTCP